MDTFDHTRANLSKKDVFPPFYAQSYSPLEIALKQGLVDEKTPVVVRPIGESELSLRTDQITYHHVAQGEIDGEPWMVSF